MHIRDLPFQYFSMDTSIMSWLPCLNNINSHQTRMEKLPRHFQRENPDEQIACADEKIETTPYNFLNIDCAWKKKTPPVFPASERGGFKKMLEQPHGNLFCSSNPFVHGILTFACSSVQCDCCFKRALNCRDQRPKLAARLDHGRRPIINSPSR